MRCIIEKGLNAAEVWHVFKTTKLCKCHNNYSSLNNQSYDIISKMSKYYGVILEGTADMSSICYCYKKGSQEPVVIWLFGLHQILIHREVQKFTI